MKTLIVNNKTKHLQELIDFLPGEKVVVTKEELSQYDTNGFDLIVFSGGSNIPTVLRHPEEYKEEIELIKNFSGAVLGICLGAEIITEAFGGTLVELDKEHRGEVELHSNSPLLPAQFIVQEGHQIGIETMPAEFEIIAYSDHGPEIIQHKHRPIIGVQFHPEITSNLEIKEWIFNQFEK
jgi:GMP synthase-like glutamine amidotransferase